MTCCQIALKKALRKKSGFFAVLDCLTLRVLEMEGDKIGILVLAPHLLHCPVSFLVFMMRRVLNTYFVVMTKSLLLSAVVPGHAHTPVYIQCLVSEYSELGCAGVMHQPSAFYSARFCSGEDASFVLAELEQEMSRSVRSGNPGKI